MGLAPDAVQARHGWLAGALALAALALATIYFFVTPITNDGGWYAYPSYAISVGGDPSENLPGVALPPPDVPRVVAKFGWENRSSLIVPVLADWFAFVTPDWQGLKQFGIAMILVVLLLAAFACWRMTRHRLLTLVAVGLIASDSTLLATGLRDARPDVCVTAAALALLLALLNARARPTHVNFAVAALVAVLLPLVHVTAANAVVLFMAFCAACFVLEEQGPGRVLARTWLAVIAVLLAAAFFLRQFALDVLVPTVLPLDAELPYRHSLVERLHLILKNGALHKLALESERWGEYFVVGNAANLLLLAAGVVAGAMLVRHRLFDRASRGAIALMFSVLASFAFTVALDPHPTRGHALIVGIIGLIAAAATLARAQAAGLLPLPRLRWFATALLAIALGMKAYHSFHTVQRFAAPGISNRSLAQLLDATLPADRPLRIIGPTELWPYLVHRPQHLVIVDDDRSKMGRDVVRGEFQGAEFLVINEEYVQYGWLDVVAQLGARGRLERVAALGDCRRSADCIEIYRIVGAAPRP
jgi:hypothetical protein